MSAGFNDIYVLAPARSRLIVQAFLDGFTPERVTPVTEYRFPGQSGAADILFADPMDAIHHCIDHPAATHAVYFFNAGDHEPWHSMVFFTGDGGMILGLTAPSQQDDLLGEASELALWLYRLRAVTGAREGYALWESGPSYATVDAFLAERSRTGPPKLVGGEIVLPEPGEPLGMATLCECTPGRWQSVRGALTR